MAALTTLALVCWLEAWARYDLREVGRRIQELGGAFADDSIDGPQTTLSERICRILFRAVPSIISIDFSDAPIADRDLRFVMGLRRLRSIDLSRTGVTAEGLRFLQRLPSLEVLVLAETPMGDEACDELIGCTQLRRLDLRKTSVTDGGLRHLYLLGHLRVLNLEGTLVSPEAMAEFQDRHPLVRSVAPDSKREEVASC